MSIALLNLVDWGSQTFRLWGSPFVCAGFWLKCLDISKPCSSTLPDEVEPKVLSMFQASVSMLVGNGKNTLFWMEKWTDGEAIADLAPCLPQAVGPHIRKMRTVHDALQDRCWVKDITGGLTVQAVLVYLFIWEEVCHRSVDTGVEDRTLWERTADNNFTTTSTYHASFLGQHSILGAEILAKTRAPGKCKFFLAGASWALLDSGEKEEA